MSQIVPSLPSCGNGDRHRRAPWFDFRRRNGAPQPAIAPVIGSGCQRNRPSRLKSHVGGPIVSIPRNP
ncbi:hypothetical protein BN2364_3685 [Alloalcanivorax xenomutans]|nr:hypothetical protein BN2364_3685 [Alloalcanivorax xenomutans]